MQASRRANHCMATSRREAFPGKEKATPSPQTGTAKLRGAVNQISPKPKVSTAPLKQTRPAALRTPTTGVSKPQTSKPASPATATKPAQTRTRPLVIKTATPTLKTRVSAAVAAATPVTATGVARRASTLPVKAVAPPKRPPAKKWKPVEKEEGKRRLSTSSVGSGRRSSIGSRKESVRSAPAKKEHQITSFNLDKNEDLSICNVPEPEMKLQDIEYSYLNEKTVQSLSNFEKGIDDIVRGDQEPLNFAKIENAVNHADPTIVIAGSSTISGQHETPADIKTKENVTDSSDIVENIADNSQEELTEKEVKVVEVAAEEQAAVVSKVAESKEIEPAVVNKQENSVPEIQQEKSYGKYDSPVSNNVIEETANKLREMRRNKVRALAGAFETVISLQEK